MISTDSKSIRFHSLIHSVRLLDEKAIASRSEQRAASAQSTLASTQQMESLLSTIAKSTNEYVAVQLAKSSELEEATAVLAVAIAEQIVGQSVDAGTLNLMPLVKEGVKQLAGSESLRVRLNPKDLANLQQSDLDIGTASPSIHFVADASLVSGSCIVESEDERIASSLRQRLDDAKRIVLEGLQHGRG